MSLTANLGPLVAGTWLSGMLWSIEVAQAHRYYRYFKQDPLWQKLLVLFVVAEDTVGTLAGFADVWMATLYGVSALATHALLIFRIWTLSKKKLLCVFLSLVTLTSLGGCIAFVSFFPRSAMCDNKLFKISTIWLSMSSACDILIAITMVGLLQGAKRQVASVSTQSTVNTPLSILRTTAFESGIIPACWTLVTLLLCAYPAGTTVSPAMMMNGGKIYVLTLLYNLNVRKVTALAFATANNRLSTSGGSNPGTRRWSRYATSSPLDLKLPLHTTSGTSGSPAPEADIALGSQNRMSITLPPPASPRYNGSMRSPSPSGTEPEWPVVR